MANPAHVAKLKAGKEVWNRWRKITDEKPDLSGLKLNGFSFAGYNLESADFSFAELKYVRFELTLCTDCSFENSTIVRSNFNSCNLSRANFQGSLIGTTVFRSCALEDSDFMNARL